MALSSAVTSPDVILLSGNVGCLDAEDKKSLTKPADAPKPGAPRGNQGQNRIHNAHIPVVRLRCKSPNRQAQSATLATPEPDIGLSGIVSEYVCFLCAVP